MLELFFPLFVGVAGSLHCIGMCGPLVIAYSLNLNASGASPRQMWRSGALHHFAFHAGRVTTYALLGGAAALLMEMADLAGYFKALRSTLTLASGLTMIILGFSLLRILRPRFFSLPQAGARMSSFRLINSRSLASKYLLGVSVGFLPCMLPWAMIMKASASQSLLNALFTMVLFGLGTTPVLFFTGLFASLLSFRVRFLSERVAGFAVIAMGAILALKGSRYFF